MIKCTKNKKGFTLLEVLLVIAIIAILAAIVIIAINPSRQLAQSRNAQRRADVNTILNAVYQYAIDNNGAMPATITVTPTEICRTDVTADCTDLIDLSALTTSQLYLVNIPNDSTGVSANGAGYTISISTNGRITVNAPDAELSASISVTR